MVNTQLSTSDISDLELELLIKAIHYRYGFDFSSYKRDSLRRRILLSLEHHHLTAMSQLIPKILWDPHAFELLLQEISVPVTEFFRDPSFYKAIRQKLLPIFKTYPKLRIWIVGCATGEEAYSIAILLKEAGITHNVTIYASDMNQQALDIAQRGIYQEKQVALGAENYLASGGESDFYQLFQKEGDGFRINPQLALSIHFFGQDLTHAAPMSHLNFICCRNVFIYFNRQLQTKSGYLFYESLLTGGHLALGTKETLSAKLTPGLFEIFDAPNHIYRKWPT